MQLKKKEIEKIRANTNTINKLAERIETKENMAWNDVVVRSLQIQRLTVGILSILEK